MAAFKDKLRELWFDPYDRASSGSALGSSGFEHVFMGESKNGDVSGFHNWLKYRYEEDEQNSIEYYGYLEGQFDLGDVRNEHLLNETRQVSSMIPSARPQSRQ